MSQHPPPHRASVTLACFLAYCVMSGMLAPIGVVLPPLAEQLGEREHRIYNNPRDPGPQVRELVVPQGHYFTMGDNRDHSNDSRYWGFVPEDNIVGRAFAVWMHWDGGRPSFTSMRRIE